MFSSLGLFSAITCPFNDECELSACIFRHTNAAQRAWLTMPDDDGDSTQAPPKRRKLSPEITQPKTLELLSSRQNKPQASVQNNSGPAPVRDTKPQAFVGSLIKNAPAPVDGLSDGELEDEASLQKDEHGITQSTNLRIASSVKSISPPPIRRITRPSQRPGLVRPLNPPTGPKETLNPRMIRNDPAGHATRTLYLKKLHEGMTRLNNEVMKSSDSPTKILAMTEGQLITLALDEEVKIATESPAVYANVIKLRMVAYKRMTLEQWKMARLEARVTAEAPAPSIGNGKAPISTSGISIDTGLNKGEEVQILSHLVAKQHDYQQFGLVIAPPSEEEIRAAVDGVEASQGWEQCERCKSRFQVFPDRREDGALTTGGNCTYHHGRVTFPDRDQTGGRKDRYYSCCNESVGVSAGCTTGDSHVFKIYDGKRLASVLQYEKTPNNPTVADDQAVAFDCEMGFTVNGMELIRLTATSWPGGEELLDVLVRPLGAILDLNSRYSGVYAEHFLEAVPYNPSLTSAANSSIKRAKAANGLKPANGKQLPPIVDSPMAARNLLFKLLSPSTPLIGHAIENDLNAARIVHPCIVDTVLLYPHPSGLPRRRALKALTKQQLGRDIQNSGSLGHDSKEDAIATGDLVRLKVAKKWKEMQREGWTRQEGRFMPPLPGLKPAPVVPKQQGEEVLSRKRPIAELGEGLEY